MNYSIIYPVLVSLLKAFLAGSTDDFACVEFFVDGFKVTFNVFDEMPGETAIDMTLYKRLENGEWEPENDPSYCDFWWEIAKNKKINYKRFRKAIKAMIDTFNAKSWENK